MHFQAKGSSVLDFRRISQWLLALAVFCGVFFGCLTGSHAGNIASSLMRSRDFSPVSIVSLAVYLFPFLISAFAVFLSWRWLLIPFGFVKGFAVGFCSICIVQSFGQAGWMIWLLLMGPDVALFGVLCWFLWRHILNRRGLVRDVLVCVAAWLAIGSLNFHLISPFLARLL